MTARLAIPLILLAAAVWLLGGWQERRGERRARAAHPAGRARAAREPARAVPGRPVDGEPLSEQEWRDFVGSLFASNTHIPEPVYGQAES